jgi:hypothetical protein
MAGNFGFRGETGLSGPDFFGSVFWGNAKKTMENKFETGC